MTLAAIFIAIVAVIVISVVVIVVVVVVAVNVIYIVVDVVVVATITDVAQTRLSDTTSSPARILHDNYDKTTTYISHIVDPTSLDNNTVAKKLRKQTITSTLATYRPKKRARKKKQKFPLTRVFRNHFTSTLSHISIILQSLGRFNHF